MSQWTDVEDQVYIAQKYYNYTIGLTKTMSDTVPNKGIWVFILYINLQHTYMTDMREEEKAKAVF